MNLLEVNSVTKQYSGHKALDDVSLAVPEGKVYGLLGPNGAGKTTLIRIINHITAPDSGTVIFDGHQLVQADVAHIGYLPEERGLYKKMKVGDQAVFFARLKGLSKPEAVSALREWFDRFEISSWWNRKVEELSKGMAQKIQFIITVLHRPRLLIFDEPFSGFDPINANLLRDEILRLRDEGSTIIFSTHNMGSVEEICDNITLLNHGRNILTGNVDELRRRFSDGRYTIDFKGDPKKLLESMNGLLTESSFGSAPYERLRLKMHLAPGATLRDAITAANSTVEISAVNETIASMNDIFIETVGNSNLTEDELTQNS